MQAHWDAWLTEADFKNMSASGVQMVRLPIGDWTVMPYSVYKGCMDGADKRVQWALDTASRYNITVLIDVVGLKGS
jgi:glucan 1,3-beta-glucosidase